MFHLITRQMDVDFIICCSIRFILNVSKYVISHLVCLCTVVIYVQ